MTISGIPRRILPTPLCMSSNTQSDIEPRCGKYSIDPVNFEIVSLCESKSTARPQIPFTHAVVDAGCNL